MLLKFHIHTDIYSVGSFAVQQLYYTHYKNGGEGGGGAQSSTYDSGGAAVPSPLSRHLCFNTGAGTMFNRHRLKAAN